MVTAGPPREFDTVGDVHQVRWREGLRIIAYLYRHPYDTTQIARVIEALSGRSTPRLLRRMSKRPLGRALIGLKPSLRDALANHTWLGSLPAGTLGREYLDYIERERLAGGMTTVVDAGTTAERTARLDPDEAFIQDFLFHGHDLYHLVTGYHTDLVGEVCLLAFTAAQTRNTGMIAMAMLGVYSLRLPRLAGQRMWARAFVRGLRCAWLPEYNWVALLPMRLDDVRKQLGLYPPPVYTPLYVGKGKSRRRAKAMSEELRHVG
jgi:ubiquinone biosynthesis protein COQ4